MRHCEACQQDRAEDEWFNDSKAVYCKDCWIAYRKEQNIGKVHLTDITPSGGFKRFKYAGEKGFGRRRRCTLTYRQYQDLRNRGCFYCGTMKLPISGGLDRIDNSKGYVEGNVVPCCFSCNTERGVMPFEDYLLVWEIRRMSVEQRQQATELIEANQ